MTGKQIAVGGEYDRELSVFMSVMRLKMEANRHKGRWQDMDLDKTIARIKDEVDELAEAIRRGDPIDILLESADVANFAMIAAIIGIEYSSINRAVLRRKETNEPECTENPAAERGSPALEEALRGGAERRHTRAVGI